jgi:hypothetical protein
MKGTGKKSNIPEKRTKLDDIKKCMLFALENVVRYGDTDIFPYPIERQIFRGEKKEATEILEEIYSNFDDLKTQMPEKPGTVRKR